MDADDRAGMSPEHLDRLAGGVLRAARAAASELRRDPPDQGRRMWALGILAGQTQAMLGPDLPDHPPVGAAEQEGFVRTALALAVHVRAHSWAEKDLGVAGVLGRNDVPHPGERGTADAFDVLNRLMLPNASREGWTATLISDLARGDEILEAAVKLGKYILHPTFLALTDDATRLIGEALHSLNVQRLQELTRSLRHYAEAGPPLLAAGPEQTHAAYKPMPLLPPVTRKPTTRRERPARKRRLFKGVPEVHPSAGSAPGPADSPASSSRRPPQSLRSSKPESPPTTGAHRFTGPGAGIEPDDPPEFESGLDPQLTWQPDSDESPIVSTFGGEYELGLETDVSPELDDPEYRGRDLRGPFGL